MNEHTRHLIDADLKGELSETDRDELMQLMMDDQQIATEMQQAERVLSKGLLDDENFDVDPEFSQKQWRSNVASLVAGIGITLLVGRLLFVPTELATVAASVHYLDTLRSTTPELKTVPINRSDDWVTLITYPTYDGYDELEVMVEAFNGDSSGLINASPEDWIAVWHSRSPLGNKDALAVTLPGRDLPPGIYRIKIAGVSIDPPTHEPNIQILFETTLDE